MSKTKSTEVVPHETAKAVSVPTVSIDNLLSQAINKDVPVETMERLMVMRRELRDEAARKAFTDALASFQAQCPTIKKTKEIKNKDGSTRYKYAPLESIVTQVKIILKDVGLSYTVDATVQDDRVTAICKITHEFGHSETSSFTIPVERNAFMNTPQQFASALTFAKRYAFSNALGIMTGDEDDDSNQIPQNAESAQPRAVLGQPQAYKKPSKTSTLSPTAKITFLVKELNIPNDEFMDQEIRTITNLEFIPANYLAIIEKLEAELIRRRKESN